MSSRRRTPSHVIRSAAAYAAARAEARSSPTPVTFRIAAAVRDDRAVVQRRARVEDECPVRLGRLDPADPRAAVAARGVVARRRARRSRPRPAASRAECRRDLRRPRPRARRGGRRRASGSRDCVSGSPKRQLYSSTRGPSAVSMRPAKSVPVKGRPRAASSSRIGRQVRSTRRSTSSAPRPGTGANEPIPPVFGPRSPSKARLKSWATGSATRRDAVAQREDRDLGPFEQLLDDERPGEAVELREPGRDVGLRRADDDTLSGRKAVRLQHARRDRLGEPRRRRHARRRP